MKINKFSWNLMVAWGFLFGVQAFATVAINWSNAGAFVTDRDNNNLPAGGIAQLIWVGNDGMMGDNSALNPANPLENVEDDLVVRSLVNSIDGVFFLNEADVIRGEDFGLAEDTFVGSQFYVRVFDDQQPGAGSYYGLSSLSPVLTDGEPPNSPLSWDFTGGQPLALTMLIPEPTSISLFMVGLAVLARRSKKIA